MKDTALLGRKRGLLLALAFGCVGAILLPVLAYSHQRPTADRVSSDDEMYEVYSAAIRDLFLRSDESTNPDDFRTKLVVIGDHTISYRWDDWNDPTKTLSTWAQSVVAVDKRTVEDFKRKCKVSIPLEPRFALPAKQVLISDRDFARFRGVYERHRNFIGYI